eukprot:55298-Eustigmatos_ZCMA.PRE.1
MLQHIRSGSPSPTHSLSLKHPIHYAPLHVCRGQVDPGDAILRVLSDNIDDLHALFAAAQPFNAETAVEGNSDMPPGGSDECSADWRRLVLGLSSCVHARRVHRRAL